MRVDAHIRLPAVAIRSAEDFQRFKTDVGDLLNERYRREQALASREATVILEGTCGLCQRVTAYSSTTVGGHATNDGRRMPNWREGQVCGCGAQLNSRQRALLHMVQPRIGARSWFRVAVLGQPDAVWRHVHATLAKAALWPGLLGSANESRKLPAGEASTHMVLSADHLQLLPPLAATFSEVHRVLSPGGVFAFTVPINAMAERTRTDLSRAAAPGRILPAVSAEPVHEFGWDLPDTVRQAGFMDCIANCYWSEELGYLGTYNMAFLAIR